MTIDELLTLAVKDGASDLHITAGLPPMLRVDGNIRPTNGSIASDSEVRGYINSVANAKQRQDYANCYDIDFAYCVANLARFRVNAFVQQRGAAVVFRVIPDKIPSLASIAAPNFCQQLCTSKNGLILITGVTGSGKSTTLAAMLNEINNNQAAHILTVEDPIEFVHSSQKSIINQRQVHSHTASFAAALRAALREDPDIIMVGEMRDLETVRLALTAAETGHLVLATLHTSSAAQTVGRIVDVFPTGEKDLIRSLLAQSLRAVISQTLLPKIGGGRVAAFEVMTASNAVRNLIREDKTAQIYSCLQSGAKDGMQTLDQDLRQLLNAGKIDHQTAHAAAEQKQEFAQPAC